MRSYRWSANSSMVIAVGVTAASISAIPNQARERVARYSLEELRGICDPQELQKRGVG
jgi:hypothetical protein